MSTERRSLLKKYDIPISHLDFAYVKECTSTKEMEKIVTILRSGEEGYYPDLTKKAEERLQELDPGSKLFRTEEPILTKYSLPSEEWSTQTSTISDWSSKLKEKDRKLRISQAKEALQKVNRPTKRIILSNKQAEKPNTQKPQTRIKSTDYKAWDKFDAETEVLKMDLEEEKAREIMEKKNKKNEELSQNDLPEEEITSKKLTQIEKETLALNHKDKGNDYFRVKEYESALKEYSASIKIYSTPAAFNNRAITYIKLKRYKEALSDCDECLKEEPNNVKALFRKAEAQIALNRKIDAMDSYYRVMNIDPTNVKAVKAYNDLKQLQPNAKSGVGTRIQIVEETPSKIKSPPPKEFKYKDVDLAELIKPNKIVKNKFMQAMENMSKGKPKKDQETKKASICEEPEFNLQLSNTNNKSEKAFIEEL